MTYPLVSPGTSVTITDESQYASAGVGTVPLIIIGTHEYKTLPSGSGVAEGTLPANANKLYAITSQRELLQTFGNPIFYTQNGTAVHGYELNEFGLHAAYQYLGIANRAYVIRAAIDYAQLMPSSTAPAADAANGTNWLDTANNTWGIYEYSGSAWVERTLYIADTASLVNTNASAVEDGVYPPKITGASINDLCMVVYSTPAALSDADVGAQTSLWQFLSTQGGGAWYLVGTSAWQTAKSAGTPPKFIYAESKPGTATTGDILMLTTPGTVATASAIYSTGHWTIKTFLTSSASWTQTAIPVYPIDFEGYITQTTGSVYLSVGVDQTVADNSYVATVVSDSSSGAKRIIYKTDEDGALINAGPAVFKFKRYSGTAWVPLNAEQGATEPTAEPVDGTLWFNNVNISANIKVCSFSLDSGTGQYDANWANYSTVYPNTDPNGVILNGSAPPTQSDGSALVDNDIWLDTSDTENYPKLYYYQSGTWVAIDTTNNVDPITGIAFGESRSVSPLNYQNGMKLFDLQESTNDVKQWDATAGVWTNVSGYQTDGVPYFGRKAQRAMIVKALAATISDNQDIRAETVYFNLLAAPGYIELVDEMVTLNTDMKQVSFIVGDTPARLAATGTAITTFATNAANGNTEDGVSTFDPYVGMYYPWGLGTNVDGTDIMVPPSTIALRTLAYNDSISYPWMAPAGFTRGLVTNASSVGYLGSDGEFKAAMLNNGQRDVLYENAINPIAYIPNRGLVVYGQKTRNSETSSLDRINVARLVNYLRYNLDNISKPFLFEPNDQHTRDSVKTTFERFLSNLVSLRGLYDFVVVCDESNNTAERIDNHELWVDIAIKPVQAIEFIYIPVRIVASGDDLGTEFN